MDSIMTDADLLARIEAFIAENDMPPSRFGREAMSDGALVFQLREGRRSLSLKNAEKVVRYMTEYRPEAPAQQAAA